MVSDLVQRTYTHVLQHMVEHGFAPHYTDIAADFDIGTEEARLAINEAAEFAVGCWTSPGTDQVGSWAPFNSTPTHYRVSIDGERKWFGQCGLEINAIRWLVPGKEVLVETRFGCATRTRRSSRSTRTPWSGTSIIPCGNGASIRPPTTENA